MTQPLVDIRGLVIEARSRRGWSPILRGVDLSLRQGEVLGLIGESGAGKSTLGLAAMGYRRDGCRIAAGSIRFDGIDLVAATARERRALRSTRIAYVAQSAASAFNPAFRILTQHCEFPVLRRLMSRRQAEADAVELYRRMRLPQPEEIGFRFPHQVSGGQLQRAMTAMAMGCRPDLIIFDEPTTALDVTTQIEVLSAIRGIVEQYGTSALYISHDLALVAQMVHRIMVLKDGALVEEAETRRMISAPREEYTRSLWAVRKLASPMRPVDSVESQPLVRVAGVTAAYGAATVLHGIDVQFHRGEIVAVVGESGSGKSTLARTMMGLLPPQEGTIELDGRLLPLDYRRRRRDHLRSIQLIYQMADTALNPRHTVQEIIGRPLRFYLGLRGTARDERVRAILRDVDLDPDVFLSRKPPELSGGQKQRIGIARALAAEPKLIICDEVTSALDQIVAEEILRLVLRLRDERGLTFMFITHDLSTVKAIADRVVVMHLGRILEQGSRDQVLTNPQSPYTRLLLDSVPQMDPDWLGRLLQKRGEGSGATAAAGPGARVAQGDLDRGRQPAVLHP